MILVIDNYDSFTYTLVHLLEVAGADVEVWQNDRITPDDVRRMAPGGVVLSPGPGRPSDAGATMDVIRRHCDAIPMLGVCLGHQAIGEVFGARVVRGREPVHGKTSLVRHDGLGLFAGIPRSFTVTRYHSLVLEEDTLPEVLEPCAWTSDGTIMAMRHRFFPLNGVQFHPESVSTEFGDVLVGAWLRSLEARRVAHPA